MPSQPASNKSRRVPQLPTLSTEPVYVGTYWGDIALQENHVELGLETDRVVFKGKLETYYS